MRKIGFPLEVEDGWPPYGAEHIWVEEAGNGFRIANVPFFVKGISLGDVIEGQVDEEGYLKDWRVVEPSGNSTVWIMELGPSDVDERLRRGGYEFERGDPSSLIAINVPSGISESDFFDPLSDLEGSAAIGVAVPSDRFG